MTPRFVLAGILCFAATAPTMRGQLVDELWTTHAHERAVLAVACSADGTLVASMAQEEPAIRLWDLGTGAHIADLPVEAGYYAGMDLSPTQPIAVTASFFAEHPRAALYSLAELSMILEFPRTKFTFYCVDFAFSPDGARVAIGFGSAHLTPGALAVFDTTTGAVLSDSEINDAPWAMAWSHDGTRIACNAWRPAVLEAATGRRLFELDPPGNWHAWGPGDAWIVSGRDRDPARITLHDPFNGELIRFISDDSGGEPALTPDGGLLAVRGALLLTFWRTEDWAPVGRFGAAGVPFTAIAAAPDGRTLAIGRDDGSISVLRTPRLCPADCDRSGDVDAADFVCFQAAWHDREAYADFDGSGRWDVNDFIAFYTASLEVCP